MTDEKCTRWLAALIWTIALTQCQIRLVCIAETSTAIDRPQCAGEGNIDARDTLKKAAAQ
jgi:hypothetical protein